jgi:hypothetical protein
VKTLSAFAFDFDFHPLSPSGPRAAGKALGSLSFACGFNRINTLCRYKENEVAGGQPPPVFVFVFKIASSNKNGQQIHNLLPVHHLKPKEANYPFVSSLRRGRINNQTFPYGLFAYKERFVTLRDQPTFFCTSK